MRMISCDTHIIRKALRLSLNEMAVLCDIYQMSQNPNYGYWCVKSKEKMAEWLDLSRDTIYRAISSLKQKGYIMSNEQGNLKCTQFIYNIETAQEEIAIWIKSNDTELISAKMSEMLQSENRTPSENKITPSENQTVDSTKIRQTPSENRTLDIQEINNKINNKEREDFFKLEFDKFRRMFVGDGKRGLDKEWDAFKKKYKNYDEIVPLLVPAYTKYLDYRNSKLARNEFLPSHKVFSTYINQSCWEEEYGDFVSLGNSVSTDKTNVFLHIPSGKYWKVYSADKQKYVCQKNGDFEYQDNGTKIKFEE
jgi:DNA-binding PadR family transcriptional regulator